MYGADKNGELLITPEEVQTLMQGERRHARRDRRAMANDFATLLHQNRMLRDMLIAIRAEAIEHWPDAENWECIQQIEGVL